MSKFEYDLCVIGGGSGGVRAARIASQMGKKVALAEEYRLGGTCVIRGCVPKKLFVYASHYKSLFEDSRGFGWDFENLSFSWQKLKRAKDKEITRLEHLYEKLLKDSGVKIFRDRAVFLDSHHLELTNSKDKLSAEKTLIAAGSKPNKNFDIDGIEHAITTNELFDFVKLPKNILIVGGGYTAIEFANIFHGLGSSVSIVHWRSSILSRFDKDFTDELQNLMSGRGIKMVMECTVKKIEKNGKDFTVFLSNGDKIKTDVVVTAMGRVPNIEGLNLDKIDVNLRDNGLIEVNSYMQTSNPNIWAIGDVANYYQLTPVAIHEAMCFVKTAFTDKAVSPDYDDIATAVFSQPEISKVGLNEEEAIRKFRHIEIYKTSFKPMQLSFSDRTERVMIKLVVDGENRRVLGAHVLGDGSGEIIQLLAVLLKSHIKKEVLDQTMAVHPTITEELVTMYKPSYIYQDGQKIKKV